MSWSAAGLVVLVCGVSPVLLLSCGHDASSPDTVLDGLSQPRGMSVDATTLCVAEAGAIGPDGPTRELPGQLESDTGRVVCAPLSGGTATAIVDELPFVYYPDAAVTSGAADVVRIDDRVYALVGESYGEGSRSILEISPSGSRVIADLLEFAESANPPGGVVRSNPYSFVIAPDLSAFFVTEAAAGTVLRADLDGGVELFAAVPGHEVLTGMSWGPDDDLLYVASFGQLPHPAGSGAVVAVDASGTHDVVVDGLTMAIDVAFDANGAMYVLEYATPADEPQGVDAYRDRSGRLLYVPAPFDGENFVLRDDLDRPTALSVSGDDVFVSLSAGELAAEEGSVVRFSRADLLGTIDMSGER